MNRTCSLVADPYPTTAFLISSGVYSAIFILGKKNVLYGHLLGPVTIHDVRHGQEDAVDSLKKGLLGGKADGPCMNAVEAVRLFIYEPVPRYS
jgi:hypothetical protein